MKNMKNEKEKDIMDENFLMVVVGNKFFIMYMDIFFSSPTQPSSSSK